MQVKILYEEEKLKKAIAATLIAGILIMNAATYSRNINNECSPDFCN